MKPVEFLAMLDSATAEEQIAIAAKLESLLMSRPDPITRDLIRDALSQWDRYGKPAKEAR